MKEEHKAQKQDLRNLVVHYQRRPPPDTLQQEPASQQVQDG